MLKRKKWSITILTGIVAVAVVLGAFTIRTVSAQSPTPTPGEPGEQAAPDDAFPGKGRREIRMGVTQEDLAAALGITTEQLQAAHETASAEAIKEAVARGLITQEQADQMTANGRRFLGRFGKPGSADGIDYDALLAEALNITTEQLQAARQTAFTAHLDAALQDGTLTQEQVDRMQGMHALANDGSFQSAMQAAFESGVKQAVTNGVITQAQADAILSGQGQNGGFFGRGFDFGPGGPGRRPGRGGPGLNGTPPVTPDTQNN